MFVNFVVNKLWIVKLWECNVAKSCTQISCTRVYWNRFLSRSFDRPTIEECFSKMAPTKLRNREIWQGYSRKKKTTSTKIRSRYCEKFTPQVWRFGSTRSGFMCNPQLVFAFTPNCTLLIPQSDFLIPQSDFRTCFLFPWLPLPNFSICRLFGLATLLKLSSMVGLLNQRHKKLISVRTSAWDLGALILCMRHLERNGEISWSLLIGHKKYNTTKFVLKQKQERKWAFELVR